MVWLLTSDSMSACAGRLINGSNTMLFLGMINRGNTMLLLAGADGLIDGRDTALLLLAGWWFGYVGRDADIAQIVFVHSLVNILSLCLTSTGIIVATITKRRCRFHLSFGDYFKEVSYFSNAVWLLAIP
jgi:hypothetical protein